MGSQHEVGNETVVGFDDDARRLVEKLMGGKNQLQIISVVGMAGLGKTTLVKKVVNEPSIVYHFHVRAWTTVTQEPKKSDVLLGILKSGFDAGIENCSDMELSVNLKRRLSGQRYLVVMDDIWDGKDWNDLMLCFPDDNVGSRIIFTSRLANLPLQVQYQHPLRFLTEEESWDLLQYKVFLKERCPSSLSETGFYIARKCQGLPLLIVVLAGILASDRGTSWWSQVAQDMSSLASKAPEKYMEALVLSYNHLPNHLKPCFLYFAAFPEDYEIDTSVEVNFVMGGRGIHQDSKIENQHGGQGMEFGGGSSRLLEGSDL
ncbi:NB-ARC domain-containing protein [Heracleum sosnowskyi]|uniref:NB-ARC domain-containing protein n=1 Tax=Heracleum sosnowskyi TaxID=360622 RepID=A0AAD8M587_9APIA|nr:NB-ARC domain-containing protein [Heracleum sosnowskyi]